ncbi:MAG: dUTP diphosphatase [Candidatus Thorarchaeota archaeon]
MIIEYHRTHLNAHPPSRGNPSDAGLDIHFSPKEHAPVTINPGESVILGTGLKFGVPHGYMLEVKNRSSVASKRSLLVGACVVDSGYDGEVFVNLHNVGTETQVVEPHSKIAQVVMTLQIQTSTTGIQSLSVKEATEPLVQLTSRKSE